MAGEAEAGKQLMASRSNEATRGKGKEVLSNLLVQIRIDVVVLVIVVVVVVVIVVAQSREVA